MRIDFHNFIFGVAVAFMLISSVIGSGIALSVISVFVLFRFGAVLTVASMFALYILLYATPPLPYIILILIACVLALSLRLRRYTIFVQ